MDSKTVEMLATLAAKSSKVIMAVVPTLVGAVSAALNIGQLEAATLMLAVALLMLAVALYVWMGVGTRVSKRGLRTGDKNNMLSEGNVVYSFNRFIK